MNRDEARERMIDYLEGMLPPNEADEVAGLLAGDESLAREAAALRATLGSVRDAADPPPGYLDHLAGRLVARMTDEGTVFGVPPRPSLAERLAGWLGAVRPIRAAAAIVLGLALVIGARVIVTHRTGGGADVVAAGAAGPTAADDPYAPPEAALAALTDAEAAKVADGLAEAIAADLADDLAREVAAGGSPLVPDDSEESAVLAAMAELDDAALASLYDERG